MPVAETLASFALDLDGAAIPARVRERARVPVTDTLTVATRA